MFANLWGDSPCPVCASRDQVPLSARFMGRGGVAGLVQCKACGYAQRSGLGEVDLHRIESDTLWREPSMSSKWLLARLPRSLRDRQDLAVLDVGCWEGDLLAGMPVGWRRVGVEPNGRAAARARDRAIDIEVGVLEEAPVDSEAFDLVTMMDVLEHLPNPTRTLAAVAGALRQADSSWPSLGMRRRCRRAGGGPAGTTSTIRITSVCSPSAVFGDRSATRAFGRWLCEECVIP